MNAKRPTIYGSIKTVKVYFYQAELEYKKKKEEDRNRTIFIHQQQDHQLASVEEAHRSYQY